MSKRVRFYVLIVLTVVVAGVFARLAGHWSDLPFYAAGAGLLATIIFVGLPWIAFAPDGAFRRPRLNGA